MVFRFTRFTLPRQRRWLCFLAATFVLLCAGCQGCRDDAELTAEQQEQAEREAAEREQPDFETEPAVIYPGQYTDVAQKNRTKRGHWITADFRVRANRFDAQGDLSATSYTGGGWGRPVPVESTDHYAVSTRPFSIPRGETRSLETNLYIPRRDDNPSANIDFSIARKAGRTPIFSSIDGTITMLPFQYHIVLLTNRPNAYAYLNLMDSVRLLSSPLIGSELPEFYTVVRTDPASEPVTLPRHALYWTTIAYLIWDDLDVEQLDEDQRQALVDWLYFGGQLILSGPDCLEKLGDSFLADYLPWTAIEATNLGSTDFETLNQHWAYPMTGTPGKQELRVTPPQQILGVRFQPHPAARFIESTGQMAIERQIGRGRIVATAFSLSSKPVIQWSGFRNLFNGCLLRRPGRSFATTVDEMLTFTWVNDDTSIFDPLIGSTLRFLSRDLANAGSLEGGDGGIGTPAQPRITAEQMSKNRLGMNDRLDRWYRPATSSTAPRRNLTDAWHYGGFAHDGQAGTAGWNDNSGVSVAAREILRQSAGISPPSSDFVLRMLVVYLIVLVPVNWMVFRAVGRVEWAWIAAPVIAIAGAVMVARLASLDIGFVRSNSQVGCIEVYANYPRAHVAQYSALYTSLSTGYDVRLDNPSAQALPLGQPGRRGGQRPLLPVVFRQTVGRSLENLQVDSNSTGMLHMEMMFDLQGVFSLDDGPSAARITNGTGLDLFDAAALKRTADGNLRAAWIGGLPANSVSPPLEFADIDLPRDAWQASQLLTRQRQVDASWQRLLDHDSPEVATEDVADESKATQLRISPQTIRSQLPEVNQQWERFVTLLQRRFPDRSLDQLLTTPIDYSTFRNALMELGRDDQINVWPLLKVVNDNLQLAPGETRLIAVTDQRVGDHAFEPASTQSQRQSLVVVHLNRPPLPDASPDANASHTFLGIGETGWPDEEGQQVPMPAVPDDGS